MFTVCSCKLLVSEGERQGEDWLGQESTVCSCKLLVSEGERPAGAWLTAEFTEFAEWTESLRGMPPPVFSQKRPQTIENKGRGHEKERQESSRGGKRKEVKEIEEATGLPPRPVGAGVCAEDTEPDWTRVGIGTARRMETVGGEVAGEEGG